MTSKDIAKPLIGRPTFEALGLDVSEVLEPAVNHLLIFLTHERYWQAMSTLHGLLIDFSLWDIPL